MTEDKWWHKVVGGTAVLVSFVGVCVLFFVGMMLSVYGFGFIVCEAANVPFGECWGGDTFREFLK